MPLTARFRFSKFGGTAGGSMTDDGMKFSLADRDMLDRLLQQVEQNDYLHHPQALSALPAPSATLGSAGVLAAGETYYYRYALVDEAGYETLASGEVAVTTPDILPAPDAPGAYVDELTAGALPAGVYYYALTGLRGDEQSVLGELVAVSVDAVSAVTLDMPSYGDAESFRVWRMGASDPGWTAVAIVDAPDTSFVDDGSVPPDPCACDPENLPPMSFNEGIASYSVTVALPEGVSLDGVSAWRLYRSTSSGAYPTEALVHHVIETVDEWDEESDLVSTWVDAGADPIAGTPLDFDANLRPRAFAFDTRLELPPVDGFPQSYPIVVGSTLYVRRDDTWLPLTGGGGGGGGDAEPTPPRPPVLTSPDGSRFILTVANDGSLVTQPTVFPGAPTPPENLVVV